MILSFQTDRSDQTVQTQIRLLFVMKYPKVWAFCLNFRVITARFSGIQKFRNFTVYGIANSEDTDQTSLKACTVRIDNSRS